MRKAEIGEEATSLKLVSGTLPQTPAKGARLKKLYLLVFVMPISTSLTTLESLKGQVNEEMS